MTKIGYITDCHFHISGPVNRKDNYLESLLIKLNEVIQLANEESWDALLLGGDIYHTPSPHPTVVTNVLDILCNCKCPIYTILGNHEIPGNKEAVKRRMVGLLQYMSNQFEAFPVKHLSSKSITIGDFKVKGIDYYDGIETDLLRLDHPVKKNTIMLVHANIVDAQKIFPHCVYEDLRLSAEYTFTSHYHPSLGVFKNTHGNTFISPGAMSRASISTDDLNRTPSVAILTKDGSHVSTEIRRLTQVKPSQDVFLWQEANERVEADAKLAKFIESVKIVDLATTDLESAIFTIAKASEVDDDIRDLALEKLREEIGE